MMIAEDAFREGLDRVRECGVEAKGNDIAVLAAYRVFMNVVSGKEFDPRFPREAPVLAMTLIHRAYVACSSK